MGRGLLLYPIFLILLFYLETDAITNCAKFETGWYTGTDTYGSDNPTIITFTSNHKLLFIFGVLYSSSQSKILEVYCLPYPNMTINTSRTAAAIPLYILSDSYTEIYSVSSHQNQAPKAKYDSSTYKFYIYHNSYSAYQFNYSGRYYWLAL